ncbi:MAG: hypothetical protein GX557_02955 [Chloroflexi bacterium]|nr:hypothetical protein [Chloroflexota bacterium]
MTKPARTLILSAVPVLALILVFGLLHYGSPEALYRRVRAEVISLRARDGRVPTPLPTTTDQGALAAWLAASPTVATPTASPTATRTFTPEPASPTPLPSVTPSATPVPSPTPLPMPTQAVQPIAARVELVGVRHEWQTWNNCGPVTLGMAMSYYGSPDTQTDIAPVVRSNYEDKHVGADELADYARAQGLQALVRVHGSTALLKTLLSNGLPVMMPTWHVDSKGQQMGHYRLVTGYDDAAQEWIVYDSLETRGVSADAPYRGVRIAYAEFEEHWQILNHLYVIVYPADRAALVTVIVGEDLDDAGMWQRSLERAREHLATHPDNAFAWFTLGTNLLNNALPTEAAQAFDQARLIGLPFRMLWYQFGPLQAYYEVGRYAEVVALADATLKWTSDVEELHYWRGRALLALGDVQEGRAALETALVKRPGYPAAAAALAALGG